MNHNFENPRSPTVLRVRARVAPDGGVAAFGLCYRLAAPPATLAALARAGQASLLVDATDVGSVLVRDPATGSLLHADCTRHAYACGLTLHAHAAARRSSKAATTGVAATADFPDDAWGLQPTR